MHKAVYVTLSGQGMIDRVYGPAQKERLAQLVDIAEAAVTEADPARSADQLRDAQYVFSTWGMPDWSEQQIKQYLPNCKAVFYAAGSVQNFARNFLNSGIRVFSAWQANAVPVAQYTLAQILLATKGFFRVQPLTHTSKPQARALFEHYPGNYGVKIGILGAGAIGRRVIKLLQGHDLEIWVYDPFLSDEQAEALGVSKRSLEDVFAQCLVVSNHIANLPATQGLLKRHHFMSMLPYSTFINTGRGSQLSEQDLYDALVEDPTRTALLDVLIDEENLEANILATLPNCLITPHIAGSSGQEVWRMADYAIDSLERVLAGSPSEYEVSLAMLETMA